VAVVGGVRKAAAADAAELVRLRAVMLTEVRDRAVPPGPWQEAAERVLRERLGGSHLAAYVVDAPGEAGVLAACAVGALDQRLPGPDNPSGLAGYVFNVVTDPAHRRRGHARACLSALLDWYRDRGVTRIDLLASEGALDLYRGIGFTRTDSVTMRLSTQEPR
jgi:ribosomal protein S18 acetylase RimI-like enzyme